MFTRCVSSRMCSPCSRHSTGTIGASRGRRQSCNTSGRRCCWRRRSTLTSIGCEEARTRQVLDVYSSRFALVGCESTPRRRHRVSLPGTISANFASTLVFWFRVRFFQVLQFKLMLLLQFFLLVYINWFMTKSFWLIAFIHSARSLRYAQSTSRTSSPSTVGAMTKANCFWDSVETPISSPWP